jgi:beta-N-acetylhexosaminidase
MLKTIHFDTPPSNAIVGCEGLTLTVNERILFARLRPLGLILFARNIANPEQLKALTDEFKTVCNNAHALVLIDQEGGRVSRLPKEYWRIPPSPTQFAALYTKDKNAAINACKINYQLIGLDLKRMGINVNCAPMLDIPQTNASTVVTDRALGNAPDRVIALAQATIDGLHYAGVEPVIKHGPGHGRGTVDSHKALPKVDATLDELASWDFLPFAHFAKQSMLMTAHILYSHLDDQSPATFSKNILSNIVRRHIGFEGLIMTDDIDMHALSGNTAERASKALHAGCDVVLQCSGKFDDLQMLEEVLMPLSGNSLLRAEYAATMASSEAQPMDENALLAELNNLMSQ